jgi:type I restriction enzyme S subunit
MNLLLLRANPRVVEPQFLHFVFCYYRTKGVFIKICSRSVNQSSINQAKLKALEIPVPPLPEQRKIAAVLGLVQRAIEQQERLIALTTELKKALLHKLFTEGTRGEPQKQTEIGPVPESWEIVRLGEFCALGTGTTPPTARLEYYNGDVPFVKTADIANNRITISQTNVSREALKDCGLKLYPQGTVLMAMYGQGKTRGQVSLLEISAATSQNAAAIQPSAEINSEFLWQYLMSRYQVLRDSGALGHISHLNLGYLRDFQILKPPILIQCEIAEILRTIDSRLTLIDSRKLVLNDLFRTLLHQLMTAQIRVNDLDLAELSDPIEQDVDVSPCIANDRS